MAPEYEWSITLYLPNGGVNHYRGRSIDTNTPGVIGFYDPNGLHVILSGTWIAQRKREE